MILLLGGTSDAAPLALRLAERGYRVLVSQATDVPLAVPEHPRIEARQGALDVAAMARLVESRSIGAIVDAGHPYAAELHATAAEVARRVRVPYFRFVRPGLFDAGEEGGSTSDFTEEGLGTSGVLEGDSPIFAARKSGLSPVRFAADHAEAAGLAFAVGRPVLLTVGAKNLEPYADQARRNGVALVVRVLDRPESLDACRRAGIPPERVVAGRGPFGVEENRRLIRAFGIGVLVTKDSGPSGGTPEKLRAAGEEGCVAIVVRRPVEANENAYFDLDALVHAVESATPQAADAPRPATHP